MESNFKPVQDSDRVTATWTELPSDIMRGMFCKDKAPIGDLTQTDRDILANNR